MKQYLTRIGITFFVASLSCYSCNDNKSKVTSPEEQAEIRTMDSSSKAVEENTNRLEEQTKRLEESIEKVDKEFNVEQ